MLSPRGFLTSPTARDLLWVILGQFFIAWLTTHTGPLAISDDDYARLVIAQQFADSPAFDPTGTSWLPFPFWIYGSVFRLCGSSVEVARGLALLLSLASAALLYAGARLCALPSRWALFWVLAFSCLPTVRPLLIATVPEYFTTALCVFGLATLSQTWGLRLGGALALTLGAASRYEAWPLIAAFVVLHLLARPPHPTRKPWLEQVRFWSVPLLACSFPCIWLLYGKLHHGDFFFFIQRVTEYKQALGAETRPVLAILLSYPRAFFREPELMLLSLALLGSLFARRASAARTRLEHPWTARFLVFPFLFLLTVLISGDLRGGAPTHHPERALVSLWAWGSLWAFSQLARLPSATRLLLLGLALLGALPLRLLQAPSSYAEREQEEEIGQWLGAELPASTPFLIAPLDYGYFALQAVAGSPERFFVTDTHDPREPEDQLPLDLRIQATAEQLDICYILVPSDAKEQSSSLVHAWSKYQLRQLHAPHCAHLPHAQLHKH